MMTSKPSKVGQGDLFCGWDQGFISLGLCMQVCKSLECTSYDLCPGVQTDTHTYRHRQVLTSVYEW